MRSQTVLQVGLGVALMAGAHIYGGSGRSAE